MKPKKEEPKAGEKKVEKKDDKKDDKKDVKKDDKKDAKKAEKKPPPPPKEPKKPKTPEEKLHMGKLLFIAGLCIFFLATCAERSHLHNILSASYSVDKYSHKVDKPVKPVYEYVRKSVKVKADEQADENKEIKKKSDEIEEKFAQGDAMKEYLVAMEDWREEKHNDSVNLQEAGLALKAAKTSSGAWATCRFYFGQLGMLLMIVGLGFILVFGTPIEKGASLIVIWLGLAKLMTEGSVFENLMRGIMR